MTDLGWRPRVVGIDPSLTGTGIARIGDGKVERLATVRTSTDGHERLTAILARVLNAVEASWPVTLVVIEGPSYGSNSVGQRGHHERAGLWWLITHTLWNRGYPYAVVSPGARAKYGTGNGGSKKRAVLAAARETYGPWCRPANDNEADALILAAMGAAHFGDPYAVLPKTHTDALRNVAWPETPADI